MEDQKEGGSTNRDAGGKGSMSKESAGQPKELNTGQLVAKAQRGRNVVQGRLRGDGERT